MLSPIGQAAVILGFVCAGAAIGMALQRVQPVHHRDDGSKDTVKLVLGLLATMTALILSLLIASAHSFLDTQRNEMQQLSSDVLLLDNALAQYGTEAAPVRARFKTEMEAMLASLTQPAENAAIDHGTVRATGAADILDLLTGLTPANDGQRAALARAQALITDIASTRLQIHHQATTRWPFPLAATLLCWLTLLFLFFGLLAPLNLTVVVTLFTGALSVSAAMFLMLSMSHPYEGAMRVSDAQLRSAIAQIGE